MTRRLPARRPDRAGFTLVEVTVALAVGAVVVALVARAVWLAGLTQAAAWQAGERAVRHDAALGSLRRAIRGAAATLAPAATVGPFRVRAGDGPGGTPADTVEVVLGDGPVLPVASRPCTRASAPCTVLLGNRGADFAAGDLVLVGDAALAGRLVRLAPADATRVFAAPCGPDCPERLACSFGTRAVPPVRRVVAHVYRPGGVEEPGPCPQSFLPDGSACEEVRETASPAPRPDPVCGASGPSTRFTELRHGSAAPPPAAYPHNPGPAEGRSAGGSGFRLRAQRVRIVRFWVRGAGSDEGALVREEDRDRDGAWDPPEVVAARVRGLAVETRAAWSGWVRGMPFTDDELRDLDGNPRVGGARPASPLPGSAPLGRALDRTPSDVRGLRLRLLLPRPADPDRPPGAPSLDTVTAVVPLVEMARGGPGGVP